MIIRLSNSGSFLAEGENETEGSIDKKVRFVYCGTFNSMDGEVEVTEKHLEKIVKNHNSRLSKLKRLANGDIPVRMMQPLQLDHSTSAMMTVGRIIGELSLEDSDVDGQGTMKLAMMGKVRVLGKENVEKVKDGRWADVSIGADLTDGKLNELSITPFPAAEHAAMLSRASEQTEKPKEASMTEEQKKAMREKMKKHLMDKEKLSEKDADEKLSKMEDKDVEQMSAKCTEDEENDKKAKMAAQKAEAITLMKGSNEAQRLARKELKLSQINARFSRLRADCKITPAEIKKKDMAKLSEMSDGELKAMYDSYAQREPVIIPGMFGSVKAISAAELANKSKIVNQANLEAELRAQFTSNPENVKKLSEAEIAAKAKLAVVPSQEGSAVPGVNPHDHMKHMKHLNELLSAGKLHEAKEHLKKLMDGAPDDEMSDGDVGAEAEKHMSALATSLEKLQTEHKALVKLTSDALGITEKDLGE